MTNYLSSISSSLPSDSRLVCEAGSLATLSCPNPFSAKPNNEVLECAEPPENYVEYQRLTQPPSKKQTSRKEKRDTGDDVALGVMVLGGGFLLGGGIGLGVGALVLAGCSDRALDTQDKPSLDPNRAEGFLRIVQSEAYAGRLVVFFESGEVPVDVKEVLKQYPDVRLERSVSRTAEEENERRWQLETRTDQKFLDWNRVYYIEARDKRTAEELLLDLMDTPGVRLIYPEQKRYGPTLATTPNLEGLQTYLQDTTSAGLNVTYAWDQGVYGAGVMIGVNDDGLNFDHEEFDLSNLSPNVGGNNWGIGCGPAIAGNPKYFCDYPDVAHGTATMGMVHADHGAEDDRHGIRGISPEAWATLSSNLPYMPPGSILLSECATWYSWDGTVTCQEEAAGLACVPCTSEPLTYTALREAVFGYDMIDFMTAGNGAINLDTTQLIDDATMEEICGGPATDPAVADCWETSGTILVGASQGDREMVSGLPRKQTFSNCGTDVELFGWGERVVTTTWHPPSGPLSGYDWETAGWDPDPPNDDVNAFFTNQFGGTSAAAAMVAGAATLVQSYFKQISGGVSPSPGSPLLTRYLLPWKMKEILVNSGIDAYFDDDCGIGKQPDLEQAFLLTEDFWTSEVVPAFPELVGGQLETAERLEELKALGMGLGFGDPSNPPLALILECGPDRTDPFSEQCIDLDIVPHISSKMDLDEDGRGDLVSWTQGQWKIDLSSGAPADPECGTPDNPPCPPPNDNYGSWDITLNYDPISNWEVPVVNDYNSDGKADLAIYDRENGSWHIAFTNMGLLQGEWAGWDQEIDWPGIGDSQNVSSYFYTRPLPADYNGDRWIDLGAQTSDGDWKINFGWRNDTEVWTGRRFEEYPPLIPSYANAEGVKNISYLTPAELSAYPGWAYLPGVGALNCGGFTYLLSRSPEGLIKVFWPDGFVEWTYGDMATEDILPGNEHYFITGNFEELECDNVGYKTSDGGWVVYAEGDVNLIEMTPDGGLYGPWQCKPVAADLDGDELDDRIVHCPDEIRIGYSSNTFADQVDSDGLRRVPLGYTNSTTLPGVPIFGGLSYARVEQVRDYMTNLGLTNIPPFFDYAITPYEYCDLPWFVGDMPEECL